MVLSIFSQNITLREQGASSLRLPLPPSATAHMTEAAAADYTFSCDGTAPPPIPSSSLLSQYQPVQNTGMSADNIHWIHLI